MTKIDLIAQLQAMSDMADDTEVFFESYANPCGNIVEIGEVNRSTYGFFGGTLPCIIIGRL